MNGCHLRRSPGAPGATLEMTVSGDRNYSSVPSTGQPPIAAGTGSEPKGAGLEGKAGTLWNILYNKSLPGKPTMGFSLCPETAEGAARAVSSSCLWQRGSAEPDCLRHGLGADLASVCTLWTALTPRKVLPPHALPPSGRPSHLCCAWNPEPCSGLSLHSHLSHTQPPHPCLYSNLREADILTPSFRRCRNSVKGVERFQEVTSPGRPK